MPPQDESGNFDNAAFQNYYNSKFPLDKFDLSSANEMTFQTIVKRGDYLMRYVEAYIPSRQDAKFILDFDCSAQNVSSQKILDITDELHNIIATEFEDTINEPVRELMRKPKK